MLLSLLVHYQQQLPINVCDVFFESCKVIIYQISLYSYLGQFYQHSPPNDRDASVRNELFGHTMAKPKQNQQRHGINVRHGITWLVVAVRGSEIAEIQLHSTGGSRHSTRTSNDHLVARVPDSPLITRRILVTVKVRRWMRRLAHRRSSQKLQSCNT